ncbi:MAG: Cys-tRNA(Pro) deacylase [Lachnospiraceae bacterium]|jgi:Cys-tRNA(Pro)/Cys-tRNA(Cys) deacylase|nr:Cys-tRNA(Pro) deacylase [Lachnospiraceae bacterium]
MAKNIKTNACRILDKMKINYELIVSGTGDEFVSGKEMAQVLGVKEDVIYKTLVTTSHSKTNYVFVIPSEKELNLKDIAKIANEKSIEMIHVADILKITGYMKGGCSPIGMKKHFKTFIDKDVLNHEYVYISAGKRGYQIKLKPEDLINSSEGILF